MSSQLQDEFILIVIIVETTTLSKLHRFGWTIFLLHMESNFNNYL